MRNTTIKTRNTRQQKIIIDKLRATDSHPTADELFMKIRKDMPRISLATVYRNLAKLEKEEKIQSLEAGGTQRRYDGNPKAHLHIRCRQCSRVIDIKSHLPSLEFIKELTSMNENNNFIIEKYQLELIGRCGSCR